MAPVLLGAGAATVVVGVAMLSIPVAVITAGLLLLGGALGLAVVADRRAKGPVR